jgi:hypothetical protein
MEIVLIMLIWVIVIIGMVIVIIMVIIDNRNKIISLNRDRNNMKNKDRKLKIILRNV